MVEAGTQTLENDDSYMAFMALLEQLEENGTLTLLAALLPLLAEHLLLTEGFMPCAPAEGPAVQQLYNLLARRQEL